MARGLQMDSERTFEVDGQTALPRLNGVGGVARVSYRPPTALETVYFDTPGRDLAVNQVTLRRTLGGPEEGWHVRLASGEHRLELGSPLGKADRRASGELAGCRGKVTVPQRILDVVQVHVRGRTLAPVARLNTLRSVVDLMDARGQRLAEVRDDQVAAMAVGHRAESRVQHWRRWQVEVIDSELVDSTPAPATPVSGAGRFLDAVGTVLEGAGARPSAGGWTLEKVLGSAPDPLDPEAIEVPEGAPMDLQAVLTKTVRTQLRLLKGWDPLVRRDVEDSIHQFRVVCRTLRSILQTYAPLLEPDSRKAVNRALRRLGRLLSTARDAEVVRDQVGEKLAALPGGAAGPVAALIPGRTVKRLRTAKADEFTAAHDRLLERMRTPEYAEVMDLLDSYARQVPLAEPAPAAEGAGPSSGTAQTPGTAGPRDAVSALEPPAAEQVEAVLALARTAAQEQEDPEQRIEMMHEVRKEAKRLRYAVKAVQDATGLDWGEHFVTRMKTAKKLQQALGEHRDSIMFQEHVRTTARRAAQKGEDTFGYGVLYAAEFALQQRAEQEADALLSRLAGDS